MRIALPVLLENENEILAFKKAKHRIENNFGHEVGVFAIHKPSSLTKQNQKLGIENQKKYKLPVFHAQTPIAYENSLVCKDNLLKYSIENFARIGKISNDNISISTHTGVFVFPDSHESNPYPGCYSVNGFKNNEYDILQQCSENFNELYDFAGKLGVSLALENEPIASFEKSKPNGKNLLIYKPLGTHHNIDHIAGYSKVFDSSHYAATCQTPEYLKRNNVEQDTLHYLLDSEDFTEICNEKKYLENIIAMHLSNRMGIGVDISGKEQERWGSDGKVFGYFDINQLIAYANYASEKEIPVAIEVRYDIRNITRNAFKEADDLIQIINKI